MNDFPNYDEEAVAPMRHELVRVGFTELKTPGSVDEFLDEGAGTSIVIINSVCGCAAGGARPGVSLALQSEKIPGRLGTVFAGQDKAAVARFREKLSHVAPSSPFIAVFKDGAPVKVMERMDIEGKDAHVIAGELAAAFEEHCETDGPSIPREEFEKIMPIQACGSKIPKNTVKIEGMGAPGTQTPPEGMSESDKKSWWKLFK